MTAADKDDVLLMGSGQAAPQSVAPKAPAKPSARDRIAAAEKRHGKKWEEIMVDVYEHVFGSHP